MIKASVETCLLFVILFSGCLGMMNPLHHPAHPMFGAERNWVLHYSAYDPCSRYGFWFTYDKAAKNKANNDCGVAYEFFLLLTDEEQRTCPDAQDPKCRSGFGCTSVEYKCTFECKTVGEVWGRQGWGAKRLQRVLGEKWEPRALRTIAAMVVEPRLIQPGHEPYVFNRRNQRVLR